MSDYTELTQERLKELLSYDPATGVFTWLCSGKGIRRGRRAGYPTPRHWSIRVDRNHYSAHHLAWLYVHGEWAKRIRFRNGDKYDCRIENLCKGASASIPHGKTKEDRRRWYDTFRAENVDHLRDKQLRRDFGIGLDKFQEMFLEQNGVCAICSQPETVKYKGTTISLSVDHNHTTGQIRGLLCRECNSAIGKLREDRDIMLSAIRYLDKWESNENVVPLFVKGRKHDNNG